MSFLDKLVGAVTPLEREQTRKEQRAETRKLATPGGWLEQVLDHHDQIEGAFAAVKTAPDAASCRAHARELAVLLTGHSIAEEAVLYPELADSGHKGHAGLGYQEQSMAKIQMALLEKLEPLSQDYLDKLEHLRGAVTHHMYQEESSWFLELEREVPAARQAVLAARYREEIERYAPHELA